MVKEAARMGFIFVLLSSLSNCSSGIEESGAAISSEPREASAVDSTTENDSFAPSPGDAGGDGDTSLSLEDARPDILPTSSDAGGDAEESTSDATSDVGDVEGEADAPLKIPCPGDCSGHGTCDTKVGICSCLKAFDGVACEKCKSGYEMYPICKPICEFVSHTYTETPPSSFDTVKLESTSKIVPVHCPEHPDCVGGFNEVTDFASLVFAPGCLSGKFIYKGKRHFVCFGTLIPAAAVQVILQLNGVVYWMCPGSSVTYSPTGGDLSIDCEVEPKKLGLPPPYSIKPYLKLMSSKGFWYGMEIGPPSPVCAPLP